MLLTTPILTNGVPKQFLRHTSDILSRLVVLVRHCSVKSAYVVKKIYLCGMNLSQKSMLIMQKKDIKVGQGSANFAQSCASSIDDQTVGGVLTINPAVEETSDGSQTLIHPILGDSYHSLNGAVAESLHIYISAGMRSLPSAELSIVEVGFGSGLNAVLTAEEAQHSGRGVEYTSLELYPVSLDVAASMSYAEREHFMPLHRAPWGARCSITPLFSLLKEQVDIIEYDFGVERFDLVYFDAFAPDTQPQLWSEELFARIFCSLRSGGALVTYSSKGIVKRALRAAGFIVQRLAGPAGKRHILHARKE